MSRNPLLLLLLVPALLCAPASSCAQNTLSNPPNTVDGMTMLEGAAALLQNAQPVNVQASDDNSAVVLQPGSLTGSLTIPAIATQFPFNEALPSWNGWAPADGGFRVWMSANVPGTQPAWFDAGSWGRLGDEPTTRISQLLYGVYNIDTLLLNRPAQSVSVRIDLVRASATSQSPRIRLLALSYTNSTGDRGLYSRFGKPNTPATAAASVEVPYRSQVVANDKLIGRICSPCSVAMTLAAYGIQKDTQALAGELYDRISDAYGVWHRSVQAAAQYGVRGYVTRFRSWGDVQAELARKHVISASIRFAPGEVQDPLAAAGKRKKGTQGHLVLIRGINPDGTVIVHDTGSKDYGVSSIWKQEELARAWFDKGGVAYVFTGKSAGSTPAAAPRSR